MEELPASAASIYPPASLPPVASADGLQVPHVCANAPRARSRANARRRPPQTTSAGATSGCVPGPPPDAPFGAAATAARAGHDAAALPGGGWSVRAPPARYRRDRSWRRCPTRRGLYPPGQPPLFAS